MRAKIELVKDPYLAAKNETYTKNTTTEFPRAEAPEALEVALGEDPRFLIFIAITPAQQGYLLSYQPHRSSKGILNFTQTVEPFPHSYQY